MYSLSEEQLNSWRANSHLVIPGMFADRAENLSEWINEVAAWPNDDGKWLSNYEIENSARLARRENFVPYHEGLNEVISALMGEQALLYKDRVNFKFAGGGPHWAHQDGVAYDHEGTKFDDSTSFFVSILISVDPATTENGCLEVVEDWPIDRLDILPMEEIAGKPGIRKISDTAENGLKWKPVPTQPGDVLFFTERIPHRSQANKSERDRRILYGVYSPASAGDRRESYFQTKRTNPNDPKYLIGNPHAKVES